MFRSFIFISVVFCWVLTGCLARDLQTLNPCTVSGVVENVSVNGIDKVDLLFVVDNSESMCEEQISLARELPNLVRALSSGDLNPDDDVTEDFPPVASLNVSVVTTDMGAGNFNLSSGCETEPVVGDDGVFRTMPISASDAQEQIDSENLTACEDLPDLVAGCQASYPNISTFSAGDDTAAFSDQVQCLTVRGLRGCGFEQQLDATLKALTPSTNQSIPFRDADGNVLTGIGHGAEGVNGGFVRDDALLAIILVTDEDDCSAQDQRLFLVDDANDLYPGPINTRCAEPPLGFADQALHPISRYVDGLVSLKTTSNLVLFAPIVGVPTGLVENPDSIDYQQILDDPSMQERADESTTNSASGTLLVPSCDVPGVGRAFPPRRIVETARDLEVAGAEAIVQSICQSDLSGALNAIVTRIGSVLGGACLPRDINRNSAGLVNCDVVETLPAGTSCESVAGREFIEEELDEATGVTRNVCRVTQQPTGSGDVPTEAGWFYDDFRPDTLNRCGADGQRISYVSGAEPVSGTDVRLECLQPAQGAEVTIGTPCSGNNCVEAGLVCDGETNTCQQTCETAATCPAAYRCSDRGFCVNPTCGQ